MDIIIEFNAPLSDTDTERQTYGCRQKNPEICGKNGLEGICAFVRRDGICKSPSKAWQKQYVKLASGKKSGASGMEGHDGKTS